MQSLLGGTGADCAVERFRCGAGDLRSAPGVLLVPLENEFHWSRATISFAIAVNLLLYGLIGPFAAAMMDRFGFRRLMLTALALIGIGVALTSFMHESWQLIVLWGLLVGAGTGIIANVLAAMVASRWFTVQRGLVIGVLTSSAAAGQLIFLPTLAAIVEAYGWRPVVLTLAAVALIVFPVVAILMRDRPEDVGLAPYGDKGGPKSPVIRAGNPFGIAFEGLAFGLHKRDFWLLAGSFFVCGASTNGLIPTALAVDSFWVWDSQIRESLTRCWLLRGAASTGAAVSITRLDVTAAQLRAAAGREKDGSAARRMLAIAMILDGADRKTAAETCGMDRQTLRDWVHRYNAEGMRGLHDRKTPGPEPKLTADQQAKLAELVETGPDPARHGVVRWRRVDLRDELERRFGVVLHERSVGKVLAKLGYCRLSVRPRHPQTDEAAQEAFKKTSPQWSRHGSPTTPKTSPSKSGSRTRRALVSKAH